MSIQRRQTAPDRALDVAAHVLGGWDRSAVFQEGMGQRFGLIRSASRLTPKSKALIRKASDDMQGMLSNPQSAIQAFRDSFISSRHPISFALLQIRDAFRVFRSSDVTIPKS
jgi:hypothetical protein